MKLISAPMATLTHSAFRMLVEKFGFCDEYFTEMIHAPSLLNNGQFEKYYVDTAPCPEKIVWQLTGKCEKSIVEATKMLSAFPGIGIDINMGCSAPEIVKSGAGIAWMLKPVEETRSVVMGVKNVLLEYEAKTKIHKRLSIKCRLGDDDFTDEEFFRFCKMLSDCGVELISIHPRTKKEKYREKPRYEYAEKLAQMLLGKTEVFVNGDIDETTFEKVKALCPSCSGAMIARAQVQKPWIFALVSGAMQEVEVNLLETALYFIDCVKRQQPHEFWKSRLDRFFTYYANNFSFAHYAKTLLLNAKTPDECERVLRQYFEKVPEDLLKNMMI